MTNKKGRTNSAAPKEISQTNHTPVPKAAAITEQELRDAKVKRSRSTATGAQLVKLLAFLREGPKTTHFLRTHGISHPAGRVRDLRDDDYEILTLRVKTVDAHGFSHVGVAQYALMGKRPRTQASPSVEGESQ
jgi:hypothetical protein